ncbi:MAG: DEAD/DEAH box helicase [Planctomycetota bacterium]
MSKTVAEEQSLSCRVTPHGRIEVFPEDGATSLPFDVRKRILQAFAQGTGAGLLALGAREVATELPPALSFWRTIGRRFVSRACALVDPVDPANWESPPLEPGDALSWIESVPPMLGAELVTEDLLGELWTDIARALEEELSNRSDGLAGFLAEQSSVWNVVGRVCLHLAENKRRPDRPFAFIATYVPEVTRSAKAQHVPLGRALQEYAGAKNRAKLLALLAPVSRAAEESELLRELVDSGDLYHPLSWSARQAHAFLQQIGTCERAGLVVRVPDWWSRRQKARPKATVSVGAERPSTMGLAAMLDFDVQVTLDGEELSEDEIRQLLESSAGLVLVKGRWVEVDQDRLEAVLAHWQSAQERSWKEGVSLGEAMRLLSGSSDGEGDAGAADRHRDWSEVVAGDWLKEQLDHLRQPTADAKASHGLKAELRPYQAEGLEWLWTLRSLSLGGCLADDMGLGKTIQVLGVMSRARESQERGTDLLVVPASLIANWHQEIQRFASRLKVLIVHASQRPTAELKKLEATVVSGYDVVITTYGMVARVDWLKSFAWRSGILDEAQAIKNPGARQTKSVKSLAASWRLALTGTPVENHLGELWSIFDFLNPGLLGSAKGFQKQCKAMGEDRREGFAPLRRLLRPYLLRRLKTDKRVIQDLPDKTEVTAYCALSRRQAVLYEQSVKELERALGELEGMERRGLVLAFLMRFKQICNHPSHWLGDGGYVTADSGKLERLGEICESIAARQDKVLVFTQFREMTDPLSRFLTDVFGRSGHVLHGGTPVKKRQQLVTSFQESDQVPFMVLSLKAGGTGLNLTAASHVVHFDRWWNPAVENQATDRAFRIGQRRNVLVHKFVCKGTIEERIDEMIRAKQELSDGVLSFEGASALTELSNEELLSMISLDLDAAMSI